VLVVTTARLIAMALLLPVLALGCEARPAGTEVALPETQDSVSVSDAELAKKVTLSFPLDGPAPHGQAIVADVGDQLTAGLLVVNNRGERDLEVLSVTPRINGDSLRYLGAKVAGHDRRFAAVPHFPIWPPPTSPDMPTVSAANGFTLPAGVEHALQGVELLLGFEVTAPGRSTVTAVDVKYREVGSRAELSATFPSTTAVCTSRPCEQEYGGN
jgi:hypothetical protein